ncbi:ubiquitin specific protease, putative [Ixodes scapularis]|uniref:Ubiquitin carboxyl-terminal hydrolase 32 n=1 Tax=Ixodes scapularis TaxID=6945 RepID=B7PTF9_IXOSC|nr:ubiquitin specific protease, putative [Ixodes scapularis]|eukprot:XP_002404393.1 ubiquitin specific protease, putative [Ixodes scapularis]
MGARDSKPCSITNEDASKRVTESELRRLRDAFKRASNLSGIITRQAFIKEVLGEFVPLKLAEHIFQACGGTSKGINFKDLLCGLVLLTRGTREERIRFIFNLYANEGGTHIYKNDMIKLVLACDGGYIPEAVADCFIESEKVTFEEFHEWLLQHPEATSLTRWLLSEPSSVTLSNDLETPTFYQTLAGVTHLEETDIIELEKRYWQLKTQSRTGKFDLETLGPLISPPVPAALCQGIFNAFDENRDSHIDFKEMACGVSACCRGPLTERQKFCFKVFDQDMDGMLSYEEVRNMLSLLTVLQQEERVTNDEDGTITLDEYLVWTVGNSLTLSLLNLMFQVCHVVFGLRPSSREEEGEIIRTWLRREAFRRRPSPSPKMKLLLWVSGVKVTSRLQRKIESSVARSATDDGSVVLASVTSLSSDGHTLDLVVPFDAQSAANCPSVPGSPKCPSVSRKLLPAFPQRPPSIDNTGLIVPNTVKAMVLTGEGGRLQRQVPLCQGRDFEAVPEAVWRALFQWYGGSPALPRQVVRPTPGASPELELYPITLRLYRHQAPPGPPRHPNSSWTAVVGSPSLTPKRYLAYLASFSRAATLRQVFDFLCTRLRLRPEDSRLWQLNDENNLTLLEEEGLTLEQLGIEDGEQILIEVRNKDQTWPEEMSCIINSKIDQKNQGPTEKGATGLNNLGNTCFMNAALQCVSNTRPLTQYFIGEKHLYELNRLNPLGMKGHIAKRYGDLVHDLWSGTSKTVAPLKLRWTIGKYAPRFNGFQQHDSQELLAFLLDGLHEDLNRVQEKPYVELKDSAGRPDDEVAREAWENHALRNRSVVVDLFHGQLQSTVTCKVCSHTSVRFDPFNFLSLPLPMESCVHVEVVVVRLDGSAPIRYGLQLNPDERYATVKRHLGALCGLAPAHMLLAEVCGAVVRALLPDERRVQATALGAGLFAYEVPGDAAVFEEDLAHREPQTLTQIQRMVVTCANGVHPAKMPLANGSVPSGDGASTARSLGDLSTGGGGAGETPAQVTGLFCCSRLAAHGGTPCAPYIASLGRGFLRVLNPDERYATVKRHLGALCGLAPAHMLLAEVCGAVVRALLPDERRVQATALGAGLFAYEVPGDAAVFEEDLAHREPQTLTQIQRMGQGSEGVPERPDTPGSTSSRNVVPTVSWNGVGLFAEISPGMTSSLTSNSSAADLSELARRNFVVAYHRKMMRQDVYFLSSQKTRPTLFGMPLVLPCHEGTSRQDLYRLVWTQVARLVSPLPPAEAAVPNHAQDCDDSLGYEYPFTLKAVQKDGFMCAWCPWYKFCRGCQIECDDADFNFSTVYLSIDWDPTALHLRYQASQERIIHLKRFQLLNGKWVKSQKIVRFPFKDFDPTDYLSPVPRKAALSFQRRKRQSSPAGPKAGARPASPLVRRMPEPGLLLRQSASSPARGRPEVAQLRHSAQQKESPPTTRGLSNGDVRHDACHNSVVLDGTQETGTGGEPQDHHKHRLHPGYSPLDLKYQMYALACHTGILGGGHYVSYACNPNNRWYCYNDSSCKEVQLDQIDSDSAYMLFYEREGIDYEAYMPNTEGKVPDARDIDDEFENDFRKMCVLQ